METIFEIKMNLTTKEIYFTGIHWTHLYFRWKWRNLKKRRSKGPSLQSITKASILSSRFKIQKKNLLYEETNNMSVKPFMTSNDQYVDADIESSSESLLIIKKPRTSQNHMQQKSPKMFDAVTQTDAQASAKASSQNKLKTSKYCQKQCSHSGRSKESCIPVWLVQYHFMMLMNSCKYLPSYH